MPPKASSPDKRKAEDMGKDVVKKFKSNYGETIIVLVGKEAQKFMVYRDLICDRSVFFRKACDRIWIGKQERTVRMPEQPPSSFRVYLDWLYGQKDLVGLVHATIEELNDFVPAGKEKLNTRDHLLDELVEVWVLGDFLGDRSFTNDVMSNVHQALSKDRKNVRSAGVARALRDTPTGCRLQRYIIDFAAEMLTGQDHELIDACGSTFKEALLNELVDRKGPANRQNVRRFDICKYHDHSEGEAGCNSHAWRSEMICEGREVDEAGGLKSRLAPLMQTSARLWLQ